MLLKIGELARQTGLTVRTLHHYDAIGLLSPGGRADNGYRLYDREDVARLHRILALRRLGLGLEETKDLLAEGRADIGAVVARQIEQLDAQIEQATLLRERLRQLQDAFASAAEPDMKEWLQTLELMAVFDKHLTPEETARWRSHDAESRRDQAEAWKTLIAEIHALMAAGTASDAPAMQAAVRRWLELIDPHIKRSPQLMLKLDTIYRDDPVVQAAVGTDAALVDYVTRAAAHYRLALYARHLEPAQLASIRARYLAQPNGAWVDISRDLRALMDAVMPATDPAVAAVCLRWRDLFDACFGRDPDIRARILHAQASDPDLALGSSWDRALRAYLRAGLAHLDAREAHHA